MRASRLSICAAIIACSLMSAGPVRASDPVVSANSPILSYDFEDSNDPTSNSGSLGGAYDGQLTGDASFAPFGGLVGVSLDGDGDHVLSIGLESAFDIGDTDFSLYARIQTTHSSTGCGTAERGVIWKERTGLGPGTPGYTFGVIKSSGLVRLALFDNSEPGEELVGATPVNDGMPHEILGVRRGDALEVYVDRVLDGMLVLTGTLGTTNNDNALVIGGRTLSGTGCTFDDDFDGSIDEIRIYDEAVMPGSQPVAVPPPVERKFVFALHGVWPNPTDSRVRVSLELPSWIPADLVLYDLAGRRVSHRAVGDLGPGQHVVALGEGANLRPGVYFVRLLQGPMVNVKRIVVTR